MEQIADFLGNKVKRRDWDKSVRALEFFNKQRGFLGLVKG